jgi:hypothetical protein
VQKLLDARFAERFSIEKHTSHRYHFHYYGERGGVLMRATGNGNDLLLLQRTAWLICDWHRRTAVRAAAQRGTAQVLCWQSRDLCDASARLVAEAGRIEAQLKAVKSKSEGKADLTCIPGCLASTPKHRSLSPRPATAPNRRWLTPVTTLRRKRRGEAAQRGPTQCWR